MINIGILGFGTVGRATYEILMEQKEEIENIIQDRISVRKILVRNLKKYKKEEAFHLFTDNIDEIVNDYKIDVIIELTGDVDNIYKPFTKAIKSRKNIITANKALVSKYMEELTELARKMDVKLRYEAAVAGAVPIIASIEKMAVLNDIESIEGVLNGSCNFILSKLEEGYDYDTALKEAQNLGFAEADPSEDVLGYDTMRKLRILSTIAFKESIKEEDISLEGINNIKSEDIENAKAKNKRIKLVGKAYKAGEKIVASVEPTLVDIDSILGKLDGGENAIIVNCSNAQELALKGLGAGGRPTAFSVLSDFISIYEPLAISYSDSLKSINPRN